MKFKSSLISAAAACVALSFVASSAMASPVGKWKRPNGSVAKVWKCSGGIGAKVIKGKGAGTTMFSCAKKKGSAWKGNMKHPDMPGFMNFNGTVTGGGSTLRVKGCAMGQSMCDSETWKRIK